MFCFPSVFNLWGEGKDTGYVKSNFVFIKLYSVHTHMGLLGEIAHSLLANHKGQPVPVTFFFRLLPFVFFLYLQTGLTLSR